MFSATGGLATAERLPRGNVLVGHRQHQAALEEVLPSGERSQDEVRRLRLLIAALEDHAGEADDEQQVQSAVTTGRLQTEVRPGRDHLQLLAHANRSTSSIFNVLQRQQVAHGRREEQRVVGVVLRKSNCTSSEAVNIFAHSSMRVPRAGPGGPLKPPLEVTSFLYSKQYEPPGAGPERVASPRRLQTLPLELLEEGDSGGRRWLAALCFFGTLRRLVDLPLLFVLPEKFFCLGDAIEVEEALHLALHQPQPLRKRSVAEGNGPVHLRHRRLPLSQAVVHDGAVAVGQCRLVHQRLRRGVRRQHRHAGRPQQSGGVVLQGVLHEAVVEETIGCLQRRTGGEQLLATAQTVVRVAANSGRVPVHGTGNEAAAVH
ncbi:hypothetical protein TYRP_005514 [Tyrophagus putrescentiae]|nr:hypothetical protein TYRP_005514 [Tyrophagus putrescentiae]